MKQSKAVAAWLESYDNPMKDVVRRVRDTILHADARIREKLEGSAPAFSYRGTLATIFPESKKHASLMVERGAEIPGHHPRLEGSSDPRRVMKIHDMAEAHAAAYDLQHLVRSWCDWRDADVAESDEAKARARRKPAAKKKAAARKKAARPAAKKSGRPAAKKSRRPTAKKSRRPTAKKSANKKASSRKRAARPAAKKASRRTAPRSRGR